MSLGSDQMVYSASGQGQESHYVTYLAIRNKETGKTRLVETNSLVLKPVVTPPAARNPTLKQEDGVELTAEEKRNEKWEASKHLIKAFGQQKGSRFYEQQDRMRIEADQVDDKAAKAAASVDLGRLEAAPVGGREVEGLLPPRDDKATRPQEVYSLAGMLSDREREVLREAARVLLVEHSSLEALQALHKEKQLSGLGVALLGEALGQEGEQGDQVGLGSDGPADCSQLYCNDIHVLYPTVFYLTT